MGLTRAVAAGAADWRVWVLPVVLQSPVAATIAAASPWPAGAAAGVYVLSFVGYALLLHTPAAAAFLGRAFSPRRLLLALVLIAAVNAVAYPRVDGLKSVGRGSDRDDALRTTAQRLVTGQRPIYVETYLGNSPSPGPAWALAVAPLALSPATHFAMAPAALAILLWLVRASGGGPPALAVTFVLAISSGAWWRDVVTGSDLFVVGVLFSGLAVALSRWRPGPSRGTGAAAILLLLASSSRVVLAAPAALMATFVRRRSPRAAAAMVALTMAVAAAHYAAWPWADELTPFHVLRKAVDLLGPAGVAASGFVMALVAWRVEPAADSGPVDWWLSSWAIVGVPLALMSLARVWQFGFVASQGATVLEASMALLIGYAGLTAARPIDHTDSR